MIKYSWIFSLIPRLKTFWLKQMDETYLEKPQDDWRNLPEIACASVSPCWFAASERQPVRFPRSRSEYWTVEPWAEAPQQLCAAATVKHTFRDVRCSFQDHPGDAALMRQQIKGHSRRDLKLQSRGASGSRISVKQGVNIDTVFYFQPGDSDGLQLWTSGKCHTMRRADMTSHPRLGVSVAWRRS